MFAAHLCHFVTMGQGFMAGLALHHYGPKPKPFKFLRKHVGKFVIAVIVGAFVTDAILKSAYPDPPGFVDPNLPKE